ncbi:DNA-directed RNA polymerase I subunit RPA49 [Dioscorea cayenensis subsp. rotundata]|uniref:DNA-directed RNA polymerase I subunit RPA49 n=1 Tax=Dioscorea cayennensis subsp. rotundata TaxID=55577 RepID=A0AB40D2C2_DIOCR|nr:DNA-directed RNA polymerase I subunit RPA49 [Dioscorea cayenensis subsp. rotundata]
MEEVESRREPKSKKRKRLQLSMEVLSETPDRIPPLLGYFPSGYNPEAEDQQPEIKVFRNQKRSNRLELVVSPGDSNMQFVGRSYAGEAATPQLCTYALGVLDKESQSLKIVPIAANKVFRLEPRVVKSLSSEKDVGEVLTEEGASRKISDLTSLYGTKKNKDQASKWKLLNEQKKDGAATELLEGPRVDDEIEEASEVAKPKAVPNIPPFDITADTPEKAYLLDEIILPGERRHLIDIFEMVQSGVAFDSSVQFWEENGYPSFVYNRIYKLRYIEDEEELKNKAAIYSYITHLVTFMSRMSRMSRGRRSSNAASYNIPRVVYQKFTGLFIDPESHALTAEKRELLIGYILVLTLFVDDFRSEPADISKDLKIPYAELKPYYKQLGCKMLHDTDLKKLVQSLPAPLKFPEQRPYRRKRE